MEGAEIRGHTGRGTSLSKMVTDQTRTKRQISSSSSQLDAAQTYRLQNRVEGRGMGHLLISC